MTDLKDAFDSVAEEYDRYRTGYDPAVIDEILKSSRCGPGSLACEIGSGTGQATRDFLLHGLHVTCVEPGKSLAAILRRNISDSSKVKILNSTFEESEVPSNKFDLVLSAQAFHWVEKSLRYQKVHDILKPGGTFAAFWKRNLPSTQPLTKQTTALFKEFIPEFQPQTAHEYERDVASDLNEIIESELFDLCQLRRYPYKISPSGLTAREEANSYRTWSMAAALPPLVLNDLIDRLTTILEQSGAAAHGNEVETSLILGRKRT